MAIANYTDLVASIQNWTHKNDSAFVAAIPDFVRLAESRLQNDLDVRQLDKIGTVSMVSGTNYAALPSDFNQLRSVSYNSGGIVITLDYMTPQSLYARWNVATSSNPKNYTIEGINIYFGPTPSASGTLDIVYKSTISGLSGSNPTNDVLTSYPEIYLHSCLIYAGQWARDVELVQGFEALYQQDLDRINGQNWAQSAPMTIKQG